MIVIEREELKEKYPHIIKAIQASHVMEDNIERELYINNKPVKNLGHSRYYFTIIGDNEFFIRYILDHIIMDVEKRIIARRLEQVILYESYQEFEAARVSQMSTSKDQTGLHFN